MLITGARIIDPSQAIDRVGHLLVRDGRVAGLVDEAATADEVIDAAGCIVCPGFVDLHVAFREPGHEDDEDTATGSAAALAGGFTTVACTPDTEPVVDNRGGAEFIIRQAERAGHCKVLPLGAVTRNLDGKELAEIGQLVEGGAVGFTDAKRPLDNAEVMRRALEYTRMFGRPILSFPQVPELAERGVMHEGRYSMLLGLRGIPAAAETIAVGRDIALCDLTGGRLHLMCLSTRGGVEQVRQAKREGVAVTADVTPHHLALTDETLRSFDSNYKVEPPLRSREHVDALIAGLKDGTIDAISSDHQPYAEEKKDGEIDLVPAGTIGLETLLPICIATLIEPGHIDWPRLIELLSTGPARILSLEAGTLRPGAAADVTIIDPTVEWTIDPADFRSKSRNTPFAGRTVRGRARTVFVGGQARFQREQLIRAL
ncbi:MAG: dihydroorotase [Planctomycetaceae bacterium]